MRADFDRAAESQGRTRTEEHAIAERLENLRLSLAEMKSKHTDEESQLHKLRDSIRSEDARLAVLRAETQQAELRLEEATKNHAEAERGDLVRRRAEEARVARLTEQAAAAQSDLEKVHRLHQDSELRLEETRKNHAEAEQGDLVRRRAEEARVARLSEQAAAAQSELKKVRRLHQESELRLEETTKNHAEAERGDLVRRQAEAEHVARLREQAAATQSDLERVHRLHQESEAQREQQEHAEVVAAAARGRVTLCESVLQRKMRRELVASFTHWQRLPRRSKSIEPADDIRQQIIHIYEAHNPSKVVEVDKFLAKYRGREAELLLKVQKKYNVHEELEQQREQKREHADAVAAAAHARTALCEVVLQRRLQRELVAAFAIWHQLPRRTHSSMDPAVLIRQQIVHIYQQHNPSKMVEVDKLMAKFRGHETELLERVRLKYNIIDDGYPPAPAAESAASVAAADFDERREQAETEAAALQGKAALCESVLRQRSRRELATAFARWYEFEAKVAAARGRAVLCESILRQRSRRELATAFARWYEYEAPSAPEQESPGRIRQLLSWF